VLAAVVSACVSAGVTAGLLVGDRSPALRVIPAAHRAGSITTVSSSLSPSLFGRSVTFTATVTVPTRPGQPPSGTVGFSDGSTLLGTSAVSEGRAVVSTTELHGGQHVVIAAYAGDADVAGSTGSVSQRVDPAPTRLMASTVALAAFQLSAMLTRADTGAPVASRTIVMSVAGEVVCRAVTVDNGSATCNGFGGALGILFHKGYTASFAGDADYRPASGQGGIL
jgi:Bacterial Ig-like domain (group 3)